MITVKEKSGSLFEVDVESNGIKTVHEVTLDDSYYQRLTGGKIEKKELIKKSFEFLLERESNSSILSRFNLKVINNYFPEYESVIRQRI